jgi:methylmalonyl-CoA mutase
MSNSKEKLFSEFPPVSTEQWMNQIIADLKGADFDKKLVWKTNEGFDVLPFYRAEDIENFATTDSLPGVSPFVRGTKRENNWLVRQDIEVDNIAEANAKALTLLNKGVTSLGFEIDRDDVSKENIALLLKGINPEAVELNFTTCSMHSVRLIRILVDYFKETGHDLTKIRGSVNLDFIGRILRKGVVREEWLEQTVEAVKAVAELRLFKAVVVNAYLFNNAGATITQELGYALAWGNELLSRLVEAGIDTAFAAKKITYKPLKKTNLFVYSFRIQLQNRL